jgi:hypothetical protein
MSSTIQTEHFTEALKLALDEAFGNVTGIFLDDGESLFQTLATVSAAEASIPVGGKCATLAAQVAHTAFYLEVLVDRVRRGVREPADWGNIWNTVAAVDEAGWDALKTRLAAARDATRALIDETPAWPSVQHLAGAMGMIAHTAYHLGEIRQALCMLKP